MRILAETCHPFWSKAATDSGGDLPPVLAERCHFLSIVQNGWQN